MPVVVGESLKKIRFPLTGRNPTTRAIEAVDLTGCTLQAKYKINHGAEKTIALINVGLPTTGVVEFQSESDGTSWDVAGMAVGRVYIISGTRTGKSWPWSLEVQSA